jgi:hypothetical protein
VHTPDAQSEGREQGWSAALTAPRQAPTDRRSWLQSGRHSNAPMLLRADIGGAFFFRGKASIDGALTLLTVAGLSGLVKTK